MDVCSSISAPLPRPSADATACFLSLLRRWAEVILGIALALVICEFVHFREDRSFWLDGDSPARLRSFVCEMFYPLVWFQTALLIRVTWGLFTSDLKAPRLCMPMGIIVLLLWLSHAASLLFAVENNVVNVLEGRPLHWHADSYAASS
jgi:hypothetical protein